MITIPLISLLVALYGLACLFLLCLPIREQKTKDGRVRPVRYIPSREYSTEMEEME